MPLYDIKNEETGEELEILMSHASLQEYLSDNPNWKIVHNKPIGLINGKGDIFHKLPDGYNDHLKAIKKGSGMGNTIKTK